MMHSGLEGPVKLDRDEGVMVANLVRTVLKMPTERRKV